MMAMTRNRIGLLTALLGMGLFGACGSSPSTSAETDADVTASPDAGNAAMGGTGGTSETYGPGSVPSGGNAGEGGGGAGGTESSSSDSGRTIKTGTVAVDKFVGASTTSCQQVLRLNNPAQSLSGYVQMDPSAYLHSSEAQEPEYIFLRGGKDAVILPGPPVTYGAASVDVSAAQLTSCVGEGAGCPEGYQVKVNERLSYRIKIWDWEEEIALGKIELCLNNGALTTEFVFAGLGVYLGGGVAHDVTIWPILDGVTGTPTTPVVIECRTP
jgi:hypothetical protein